MGRAEDRAARFPVRRATATEAQAARGFVTNAFTDRIAWVAARTLLERVLPVVRGLRAMSDVEYHAELVEAIETFLDRHPAPSPQVKPRSAGAMGGLPFPGEKSDG